MKRLVREDLVRSGEKVTSPRPSFLAEDCPGASDLAPGLQPPSQLPEPTVAACPAGRGKDMPSFPLAPAQGTGQSKRANKHGSGKAKTSVSSKGRTAKQGPRRALQTSSDPAMSTGTKPADAGGSSCSSVGSIMRNPSVLSPGSQGMLNRGPKPSSQDRATLQPIGLLALVTGVGERYP